MSFTYIKRIKLEFNDDVAIVDIQDVTKREIEKLKSIYENYQPSSINQDNKITVDNGYLLLPFLLTEL